MKNSYLDNNVIINDISIISNDETYIYKYIQNTDDCFNGFGEIYGSIIKRDQIKAWKYQNKNIMNLFVPFGSVKLVCYYDNNFFEVIMSEQNTKRITVKPNIYYGFKGIGEKNLILNLINNLHDENSSINKPLSHLAYEW